MALTFYFEHKREFDSFCEAVRIDCAVCVCMDVLVCI
jgi:hypothetical protein